MAVPTFKKIPRQPEVIKPHGGMVIRYRSSVGPVYLVDEDLRLVSLGGSLPMGNVIANRELPLNAVDWEVLKDGQLTIDL